MITRWFALLALAGCATQTYTLAQAEGECGSAPIETVGSCLEGAFNKSYPAWRQDPHAEYLSIYLGFLKSAGTEVAEGRMPASEAAARAYDLRLSLLRLVQTQQRNAIAAQDVAFRNAAQLLEMSRPR